jgi:hypothetical protein
MGEANAEPIEMSLVDVETQDPSNIGRIPGSTIRCS